MKPSLIILQDFLRGGGTERQSILLAEALSAGSFKVDLLVGAEGGRLDSFARERLGSAVHFCARNIYSGSLRARAHLQRKAAEAPTNILCMGRWGNSLPSLCRLAPNTKLVATIRTSRPLPALYRKTIRKADAVVANSQWALREALKTCQRTEDASCHVIHNGLSRPECLSIDLEKKPHAKAKLGFAKEQRLLLSVARLEPGKGQEDLIRLMTKPFSQTTTLLILGEGPEAAKLRELTRSLGVEGQVDFRGFSEDLLPYFAAADLFLSASKLDSLPNAMIEAQAAGIPALAYPTAGIPEIIQEGSTGHLVPEGDIDTMHQQIEALFASPERRKRMSLAARKSVCERFVTHRELAQYTNLLSPLHNFIVE